MSPMAMDNSQNSFRRGVMSLLKGENVQGSHQGQKNTNRVL